MPTTIGPYRPDPKGAYSALTPYSYLDWVTDAGNSYLYINDTPSTGTALSSGTHWLKIASVGGQDLVDAAVAARDAAQGYKDAAAASAAQLAAGTASPAGTYANLAALNSGTPTAPNTAKIYITLDDGKWCYHNGSEWVAGGVYQAASVVTEFGLIRNDHIELHNGYYPISELGFANGSVVNGVWTPMSANPTYSKRVGTPAPQKFDFDITISVDSGFRIGIVRYSDAAGTIKESDTGWKTTPQVITAGTTFRFTISRATEETEVASIPLFVSKCHITASDLPFRSTDAQSGIVYNYGFGISGGNITFNYEEA